MICPGITRAAPAQEEVPANPGGLRPARVITAHKEALGLLTGEGARLPAVRAAGCLLQPEPGDLVLAYGDPQGRHYVLSVLEKAGTASSLAFPGDVRLETPAGRLTLEACEVACAARESMEFKARDLSVSSSRVQGTFVEAGFTAQRFEGLVQTARTVYGVLRSAARLLLVQAEDCVRRVQGVDSSEAGRVRLRVREGWSLSAGRAVVRAEEDVTVDGNKINLG